MPRPRGDRDIFYFKNTKSSPVLRENGVHPGMAPTGVKVKTTRYAPALRRAARLRGAVSGRKWDRG
jgi:hypothetical protein